VSDKWKYETRRPIDVTCFESRSFEFTIVLVLLLKYYLSLSVFIFDLQDGRGCVVVVSWWLIICVEINFVCHEERNNC
jgi:hypothetical protein